MVTRGSLVGAMAAFLFIGNGVWQPARAQFISGGLEFRHSDADSENPVNPDATKEARQLLAYLYSIRGKVMLSGEHNALSLMSKPSDRIQEITGRYPLIWGGEWGFSDDRDDSYNTKYRPMLLDQILEQYSAGRVIVLSYHQPSPTVGEPSDFKGGIQCKISDDDWSAILKDGTHLHQVWQDCVDRLALAIGSLQDEHIPIIFQPYQDMNGDWAWWGGNPDRFKALWAMLYDRFVKVHHLNNILWAWTCSTPSPGVESFFPGSHAVDLLGADINPIAGAKEAFPQEWYDRMHDLANDKPLGLSEVTVLPNPDNFERQPWSWFIGKDAHIFEANTPEELRRVFSSARVLTDHH